ncbi:putative inactive leucine-rich repeat receptor-like protein kinase [Capsicum chacoense]
MENHLGLKNFLLLLVLLLSICLSEQLQSSQAKTLLRIQNLLNHPNVLSSWNNDTDFCSTEPSSAVTVVCYEGNITQLHIIGEKGYSKLPENFSIDSFVTTLVKLPSLKVVRLVSLGLWGPMPSKVSRLSSLEILDLSSNFFHSDIPREVSSLTSLQTLILDGNKFTGRLPNGLGSLVVLAVLSVMNNSLEGHLPDTLGNLHNLRVLGLSRNNFTGDVPDLSGVENLQVLEVEDNSLGPKFPQVSSKIQRIALRNNKFAAGIPGKVQSYHQLEHMDISSNKFMGPFPPYLLSLPSITYLNVAGNKLTGMLFGDNQCNAGLDFVDLSTNLLSGRLPSCLLTGPKHRVVRFSNNCLSTGDRTQHPFSFCRNEALAVGILPHHKQKLASKVVLSLIICGSITGGVVLVCATIIVFRKFLAEIAAPRKTTRSIVENASYTYTSKLFTDAKYVTRAMKLGSLSLPSYRTFSSEELKVATNNFDAASFIGNSSDDELYRGHLKDGSYIAIRCLKTERNYSSQNFIHHIELMSKLRHQHLVSTLGHCFECYLDDSSASSIFLVFEYVPPNGTLRSWISDTHAKRRLTWTQRIAAAIGVARGMQFLHTGIVPGIFSNNIKITDILLDQNFVAKICSYNLPVLDENIKVQNLSSGSKELKSTRANSEEKVDVYDFGVILLEIISGRQINSKNEVTVIQNQLQESIMTNAVSTRNVVDPAIRNSCSDESLKTMIEICCRCLLQDAEDRPSVEDVIWNLQFAAQVEDAWRRDSSSSDASPISHIYNLKPNLSRKSNSPGRGGEL